MPNVYYSGDAAQTDFTVTFDYTSRSFVEVYVDALLQVEGTDYDFISDTVIRFGTAPASGTDNIEIRRNTSTTLLVDWVTGASITETNLDLADLQLLHIAQERLTETEVLALIAASVLSPSVTVSPFMQNVLAQNTESAAQNAFGADTMGGLIFNSANANTVFGHLGVTAYERIGILSNADADEHIAYHGLNLLAPKPNLLVNGGFTSWPEQQSYTGATTIPNNDGTYFADQWILVSEGNDIVDITRLGGSSASPDEAEDGVSIALQSSTLKWGIWQPIENRVSKTLEGKTVTISFTANSTAATPELGFKLVSHNGTVDVLTSRDIVGTWNAAATTDPTPSTNYTFTSSVVTGDDEATLAGATMTRFSAQFVVPAGAENLGVFIYNRSDEAVSTVINILNVKLEEGDVLTAYLREPIEVVRQRCGRFFCKTFAADVNPAENVGSFVDALGSSTYAESAGSYRNFVIWEHPTEMLAVPTVTTYNPHSTGSGWRNASDTASRATSNVVPGKVRTTIGSIAESANLGPFYIHAKADARM